MKKKISITVEEQVIREIEEKVRTGLFRNKSHVVEFALNKLMEKENVKIK